MPSLSRDGPGWAALMVLWLVLGRGSRASANETDDHARLSLRVEDPRGCLDADTIAREVTDLLGRDTFVPAQPDLDVHVELRADAAWTVHVAMTLPDGPLLGERLVELPATDCASALDATALVVAVLADIPRRQIEARRREHARSLAATLAVAGGASWGWVPGGPNALVELRGGLRFDAFSLELLAMLVPEGSADATQGQVHGWVGLLGLAACGSPLELDALRVGACAEAGGGWLSAWSSGLDETRSALRPQGFVGVGLRGELTVAGPVSLRLDLGARAPLSRDRLVVSPEAGTPEVVFEPPTVAPHASLGLVVALR